MRVTGQMPRMFGVVAAIAAVAMLGGCATRASPRGAESTSRIDGEGPAYDARLSSLAYPYAVQMLPVESQGHVLELAYMDVSPRVANGRTVLLLHGKNFSGAYWQRTIAALSDEGFRVVVPDQIGFGKSSKPETFQYSLHALAGHTKQLLDHLGAEKVVVVGHSMGGMLAIRFTLMYPSTVERLALVAPIGLEDWKRVVPYVPVETSWKRENDQSRESIRKYMLENYFHGQWRPQYDELLEIPSGWIRGPDHRQIAHVAALTTDMIFTQPVLYEFAEIKVPTLLIIGQLDRTALGKDSVPAEVASQLGNYPQLGRDAARAIPGAELVELGDAGHLPQYEAFESYFAALQRFLR